MSLIVCVDDPAFPSDAGDKHFLEPAGFESYRTKLWGTAAIAARSPLLAKIEHDLYLPRADFEEFESQCRKVDAEAEAVASELDWDESSGAVEIRRYLKSFFDALAFAREHKSDQIRIW